MSTFANPARWLIDWLMEKSGGVTNGKVSATQSSVMGIPAVYYAVNKYCSMFGQLPFYPMRKAKKSFSVYTGAEIADNHRYYQICKIRPNAHQTPIVFREMLITQALLWGNGRAAIAGTPAKPELLPMHADRSATFIVEGEKYHATMPDPDDRLLQQMQTADTDQEAADVLREAMITNLEKVVVLHDSEVLHLPGFSFYGIEGLSILSLARTVFESQLHSINHLKTQWQKGFTGSMLLQAPVGAFMRGEADAKAFLDNFNAFHTGSDNAGKVGLLREGVKANVVSMSGRDAQFVEQTRSQRQDAALLFMLESIMGDDSSVSYNSEEMKGLAFLIRGLNRWLVKWEQECNYKLTTERERGKIFFKHNEAAILRTDKQTQATIISTLITARVYCPNQVRTELLDLLPYEGGDEFENPAIDVSEEPEAQDAPPPKKITGPPEDKARAVVLSRLAHMIKVESRRVLECCNEKNFLAAIDKFYNRFENEMTGVIAECGGKFDAGLHCQKSKANIIEASGLTRQSARGAATKENLRAAIEKETATWGPRAVELTDLIMNYGA